MVRSIIRASVLSTVLAVVSARAATGAESPPSEEKARAARSEKKSEAVKVEGKPDDDGEGEHLQKKSKIAGKRADDPEP